jgi:C4-dicarboxylate transporter DctM subunit
MALLAGLATVLLIFAVPLGIVMAASSLAFILLDPMLSPVSVFRAFFNFLSKYTLMALPFFILSGFLMEKTGLIDKLFRFADALIGWVPGGFGYATLIAAVIFGAISGSSTAMAAAMGLIAFPEMIKRGYPRWLAAGCIAASGGIAVLVPPSILFIVYGVLTETSIVDLFFAGAIPGLMLALSNAVVLVFFGWYYKLPSGNFSWSNLAQTTKEALPAIMMPVLMLGGLYGGLFTPTEAGAAAAGYALLYGLIVKRGEFVKELVPVTLRALNLTSVIFLLLGCVGVFQFVMANQGWAQNLAQWVISFNFSPMGFLILLLLVMLFLSMFLTGVSILVLTVPVFFPVAMSLGIDPVWLAVLVALCMEMGGVIPPVGLNLFAVSGVTRVPLHEVIKGAMPFLSTDAIVLVLVLLFPVLALALPQYLIKAAF